jgi:hypothetical protein
LVPRLAVSANVGVQEKLCRECDDVVAIIRLFLLITT